MRPTLSHQDQSVLPRYVLVQRQSPSTLEARTIRLATTLSDTPIQTLATDLDKLPAYRALLVEGACLPVGSVEFVRAAMALAGVPDPTFSCYPRSLETYLQRPVHRSTLGSVLASRSPLFVKPMWTKLFDGFVHRPSGFDLQACTDLLVARGHADPSAAAAEEAIRYERLAHQVRTLPPDTRVWCAEPWVFVSEWRYYLLAGDLIGFARYDDGPDDAPQPSDADITSIIGDAPPAATCGIDVGVSADGASWLVEVNDAWALGYYRADTAPKPIAYLCMLWARWAELLNTRGAARERAAA